MRENKDQNNSEYGDFLRSGARFFFHFRLHFPNPTSFDFVGN